MTTEYEATFVNIEREAFAKALKGAGATLERPEAMQRRVTLELPVEKRDANTWLRVRDEGNSVTALTLKSVDGKPNTGQEEILVKVGDFYGTVALLESIGCE